MNEFISPHQNININISYNLGNQEKMPKVVFGKKLAKIVKSTVKDEHKPLYKTFKKNQEVIINTEEAKKGKSSKKAKPKKKSQVLLTLPDQQQPQNRRLKTEGNTKTETVSSLIKKEKSNSKNFSKTNTQHFKSMNNPTTSSLSKPKKSINNIIQVGQRPKKQQRRNSNKSCILSQPKKHILLSDIQHIVSTTTNGPTPMIRQQQAMNNFNQNINSINSNNINTATKKRAQSANVIKSDKFINRLLDMSVLTSELGGSIPMNQDKNKQFVNGVENPAKTALQAFMSSVDMRIIKKMQQDNHNKKGVLADFGRSDGLQLITFLNKIRRIPMEKLHQKAAKIQRFWRRKSSQFIIPYYSNMFFRNPAINSKAAIDQKLQQISDIQNLDDRIQQDSLSDNQSNQYQNGKIKKLLQGSLDKRNDFEFVSGMKVSQVSKSSFEQEQISQTKINKLFQNYSETPKKIFKRSDVRTNQFELQVANIERIEQDKNIGNKEQSDSQQITKIKINIERYKQLVKKQIENTKQSSQNAANSKIIKPINRTAQEVKAEQKSIKQAGKDEQSSQRQEMKTQSAHWNHVHNILSSNMNNKVPVMSKNVLEELMRQSAYNKQWIEGKFNGEADKSEQKQFPNKEWVSPAAQTRPQRQGAFQQYNFSQNSEQDKQEKESQDEQIQQVQYNWNKYSDISKIKKPQQVLHKNKLKQIQDSKANQQVKGDVKKKQITPNVDLKGNQLNSQQNSQNLQKIPGLLPSGVGKQLMHGSAYELINDNGELSGGEFELEGERDFEKDQKWIREQMIMQDGIVEKYLDCGLDYFGLNLNKMPSDLEKDVQQKQEHKAALSKEHRPFKQATQEVEIKKKPEHKDDDIFSNQAHPNADDDMQLVYVFQNGNKNKEDRPIDFEHAAKNSKRNDNVEHLSVRQQPNQPNIQKPGPHRLFEPSFENPPQISTYTAQQIQIQQQLNIKKKEKITQQIITKLIQQFAYDVSVILRKSHHQPQSSQSFGRKSLNQAPAIQANVAQSTGIVNKSTVMGIQTSFQSIREFITKLKEYLLADQVYCKKIVENLKNNIGPTSMEILTYLRIDERNQFTEEMEGEDEDNQEWLFVIPNELFQVFNKKLLDQEEQSRGKKLTNKFKLYTEFWHRSIFQCYNQCLDYERPYGITGAPYNWICEPKLPKKIMFSKQKVQQILESAQSRLLQLSCSSSGIIFDKPQSPYQQFQLNEEQRSQMNQQKISRMLANQILDDEYNWITYNDEITELLVDISRKIQEILIFQLSSDLKKIIRRRKMMVCVGKNMSGRRSDEFAEGSDSADEQHAVFMVEDLL